MGELAEVCRQRYVATDGRHKPGKATIQRNFVAVTTLAVGGHIVYVSCSHDCGNWVEQFFIAWTNIISLSSLRKSRTRLRDCPTMPTRSSFRASGWNNRAD